MTSQRMIVMGIALIGLFVSACGVGPQRLPSTQTMKQAMPEDECVPELCNGKDDDCDGLIDEDFVNLSVACTRGVGECRRTGKYVCDPDDPRTTTCNAPLITTTGPEICDDKDNDCDGMIDEDFPTKGQACSRGTGECHRTGTYVCEPDQQTSVVCTAPILTTTGPEVCDGLDNDCDGLTDEYLQENCMTTCGAGTRTCIGGSWSACVGPSPSAEICDNQDNDCDGQVDEDLYRLCTNGIGPQRYSTCTAGKWSSCDWILGPR